MYTSSLRSCRTTEYIVVMQEVLVKSQSWVETELSAQYFCQKQNFSNSDQNLNKNRYEAFLYLASFVWYCYFNPGIVDHLYVICITKFSIAALKLVHFTVKLRPWCIQNPIEHLGWNFQPYLFLRKKQDSKCAFADHFNILPQVMIIIQILKRSPNWQE